MEAVTSTDNSGNTIVTFEALFENTGHAPVYILGGCGGGFSSSIVGNSSVIQAVPDGPLCDCAAIIISLDQNQNHTSVNPGCWSGYSYHLVSEGMVTMNMTLTWSNNGQGFVGTNSTSIQAEFNFT